MKPAFGLALLAALFWFIIFSPWTSHWGNFWVKMVISIGTLALTGLWRDRASLKQIYFFKFSHLAVGVASAVILYILFWAGHALSSKFLNFAQSQIESIYATKSTFSPVLISFLLFFWIGPAEEIFWRGFLQRRLAEQFGMSKGLIFASLTYGLVHLWAFNFILILAALLCGFFWGIMFMRYKSIWPGIISHAVWDLAIFIIFPLV